MTLAWAAALLLLPAVVAGASTGTVSSIVVERKNVFDPSVPGEDLWPFRAANSIHVRTRPEVVGRELLLGPGSPWDPLAAAETERNLRAMGFLRRADTAFGAQALRVTTQDAWSLIPRVGVGGEGGEYTLTAGLDERNLLGYGKRVGFLHSEETGGERRTEAVYSDPRLAGSRLQLAARAADTSRGDELGAQVVRPFYSLTTRGSLGLSAARIVQDESLYEGSEESSRFTQDFRAVRLRAGALAGRRAGAVHRLFAGMHYERSRFGRLSSTVGELPSDRTLSGPVAGYSLLQARYFEETDVDAMRRVEDFNLGNELAVLAGPMLESWGSDRDRWLFSAQDQQGVSLGPGRFLLAQVGATARLARDRFENGICFASANLFVKGKRPVEQTLVAHLEVDVSERLDRERQILLGGDSGLRGYRNRSFAGSRSVLANIEDRFFLEPDFFHLFHLGWAVFLDAGTVAPEGAGFRKAQFRSDIGLGLRVSPSRSASGGVFRVDVAYALNDGPGSSRWVVSLKGGQAFSLAGSARRSALRRPDTGLTGEDRVFRPR